MPVYPRLSWADSRRIDRTVAARCAGPRVPLLGVPSCWLTPASPTSSLREAHDAPQRDAVDAVTGSLSASRKRSANAQSAALATWGVVLRGNRSRQAARSNIQAGSSNWRPPPPVNVQRNTMPSERLTNSWIATRIPNQGCHRYRTSRNSVPWAFTSVVVQPSAPSCRAWRRDSGQSISRKAVGLRPGLTPGPPPDSPGGVTSVRSNPTGRPRLQLNLPPKLSNTWGVAQPMAVRSRWARPNSPKLTSPQ